jgi:hypothetical protein
MKGNIVPLPPNTPTKNEIYRHYKGDLYKIYELALHSNDDVWMVIYEPLYKNPDAAFFTRPLSEWHELIDWNGQKVQRFSLVD